MKDAKVFLNSGQMFFGENSEEIYATLETSVAFCVHEKNKKMGGMVHYLVAPPNEAQDLNAPLDFAETAIPALLKEFKNRNCQKSDLQVTIIGGNTTDKNTTVRIALDWAKKVGLSYVCRPIRNQNGQQILFRLTTGEVLVKKGSEETKPASVVELSPNPVLNNKIKVLIVDDSKPIRKILKNLLNASTEIEIIGEACDPEEAEKIRQEKKPDVMTLDIQMPKKDGVTYLAELMRTSPMPVIMISDLSMKEAGPVMKALEIGAFDYIQKPGLRELGEVGPHLINTVKAAYDSRKRIDAIQKRRASFGDNLATSTGIKVQGLDTGLKLIAIGASTGGTEALREIFRVLPAKTPPIVVVQHMPKAFTAAFAGSLNHQSAIAVKEAEHGEELQSCTAYIAPGGIQMGLQSKGNGFQIYLKDDPPVNRFKPSVDYMFNSLKEISLKAKLNAALLTGMGEDGARGLLSLREDGAYTIAQDENTCVVYGMPRAAVERNAAVAILPIEEIAFSLLHSGHKSQKKIA